MKVQSANGGNVIKDINKIMSRVRRAVERYSMIGVAYVAYVIYVAYVTVACAT